MISATVTGNLVADGEVRAAGSTKVLSFRVASNERTKVNGEWKEQATFVSVSMFGDRAERLAQYIRKGEKIAVRGSLTTREYTTGGGEKRTSLELKADDVELMGGKKDGASGYTGGGSAKHTAQDDDPFAT